MIHQINIMLVALYKFYTKKLPSYGPKLTLFYSKLVFTILIWVWSLLFLIIIKNKLRIIETSFNLPTSRWSYIPIIFFIYIILNFFTWKVDKIEEYLLNEKNEESIKKGLWLFFILLAVGFTLAVLLANSGKPTFSA